MNASPAEIEKFVKLLAETPRRIISASKGIESARLHFRPDKEAWSANDILAHLRSCADVWGKSILAMITQNHPTLRYVSPRTWIRKTNYPELEFHLSLDAFVKQRNELLTSLKSLEIKNWSREQHLQPQPKGVSIPS
jgi:hypothetical protein